MYFKCVLLLAVVINLISSGVCSPNKRATEDSSAGAKSAEKCKEYAERFGSPNWEACSFKKNEVAETAWSKASVGQFPHLVSLGYEKSGGKRYVCTGSLISEKYVLASGHCVIPPARITIDFVKIHATNEEIKVAEPIRHPDYDSKSRINDIGLLRLDKDVTFSKDVRPVCLNADNALTQNTYVSAGFGRRVDQDQVFTTNMNVVGSNECKDFYTNRTLLNFDQHLCAYSSDEKTGCQGDPFSILHTYNNDVACTYKVIAMDSYGPSCPQTKNPDVFTKVAPFAGWIEKIVFA